MTMSSMPTPPVPLYIMMSCGCRGIIEDTTAQRNLVLTCPRHRTHESYVVERTLTLPWYTKLSPLRLFRWLGTKPKSKREAVLKIAVSFEIGVVTFGVLYVIAHYALKGLDHDR
jgi:hypothetical protein